MFKKLDFVAESSISTDAQLVSRLKSGDISTMQDIYYRHYGMIQRLISKSGGSEEDTDRIFGESMYVLYNVVRKPDYKQRQKLKIVLYSIARSLWLSEQRKKGKAANKVRNFERYIKVDISSYNDLIKTRSAGFDKTERSFRILGEDCQHILSQYYFHRQSVDEIGKGMSKTGEEIRHKKYHCVQHLKRML